MLNFILKKIRLKLLNKKWRSKNTHNNTFLVDECNVDNISIGKGTYGPIYVRSWGTPNEELLIGNYCSISENVKFLLGGNHRYDTITSYPFKVMIFKSEKEEAISKGKIIIEDDVWLGTDVLILSGVKIGKGSIIGAGSVLAKDIPPYSIVVGNPAKVIKRRFNDDVIDYLLTQDFSLINFSKIPIDDLYSQIQSIDDVCKILKQ